MTTTLSHFFVNLLAFQQALLVGVHYNQQSVRRNDVKGLVGGYEVMPLARVQKCLEQLSGQRGPRC